LAAADFEQYLVLVPDAPERETIVKIVRVLKGGEVKRN
jgi:hypothetical protein